MFFPLVIPPTILFVLCVFVLISQCCGIGKNKAMEEFNKQAVLEYRMQSQNFMHNADSYDDFIGKLNVESILQDKRRMYGKQPNDMKGVRIDWEQWPNVVRRKEA